MRYYYFLALSSGWRQPPSTGKPFALKLYSLNCISFQSPLVNKKINMCVNIYKVCFLYILLTINEIQ